MSKLGTRLIDDFQELLRKMRSGEPIPVTEVRRYVSKKTGQTFFIHEPKEVIIGQGIERGGEPGIQDPVPIHP